MIGCGADPTGRDCGWSTVLPRAAMPRREIGEASLAQPGCQTR
jgi:hypothetical protein